MRRREEKMRIGLGKKRREDEDWFGGEEKMRIGLEVKKKEDEDWV